MPTTEQGTPEWHAKRLGKVTSSRIADMLAKSRDRKTWGASRANYLADLVAERLTGNPTEGFKSRPMEWGNETEPQARAAYCYFRDVDLELIDFVDHPRIAMAGCSPDALVAADGLIEMKCPNTATHIETLRGANVPGKYVKQMQWQMACTGRLWCDFVSFDPRMPDDMRLFVRRLKRDDNLIAEIEDEARVFLTEVEQTIEDLIKRYREAA